MTDPLSSLVALEQVGEGPDEEKAINHIGINFDKLNFDTKISVLNALKEHINNTRRGSANFSFEDNYLDGGRRQSIIQSMQHLADDVTFSIKLLVLLSTICGALALPLCKMMGKQSAYLISTWRSLETAIVFIPLALYEMRVYGEGVTKLFTIKNMSLVLLCQVYNTFFVLCQLIAVQHTYSSHALLFSGMASIVLLFWKIIKRLPITTFEIMGILIAVLGSVLITQGGSSDTSKYTKHDIVVGDMIAFLGSVFSAFNLQLLAPLLQIYRDGIYIVEASIAATFISLMSLILAGDKCEFSFDPEFGLFGFLHPSKFLLCVFSFAFVYGAGFLWAVLIGLRNISPLLISLTFMVQPMLAQLFSTAFGLEPFPGMMTVIGGVVVLAGLLLVAGSGSAVRVRRKSSGDGKAMLMQSSGMVEFK